MDRAEILAGFSRRAEPARQIQPETVEPARAINPNWPAARRPDAERGPEICTLAEWVRWYVARPGGKGYPWPRKKIEEALALCTPKATWRQLHVQARCRVEVDEITGRKRRVLREEVGRLVPGRLDGQWTYGAEHHWRARANQRRCAECKEIVGQDWLRKGRCAACDQRARRKAKRSAR